jgi:hypothetical protein
MGGVADLDTAELYEEVWSMMLDVPTREALIKSLNIDGSVDDPAVQPTYMPALITQAVKTFEGDIKAQRQALESSLRYLKRVMTTTDEPEGRVSVIERNVLGILKEVVQSPEFVDDPSILERADVPKGVAAKCE